MTNSELIAVLVDVVVGCGKLALRIREEARGILTFTDKNEQRGQHFSTNADEKSLERGAAHLRKWFPEIPVIAEEQENLQEIPSNCILFDPIDGTTNFFNGLDDFGVTACMLRNGLPYAGATFFPVGRVVVSAVLGEGCYVNDGCVGGVGRGRRVEKISWHGKWDKLQIGTDVGSWAHTHHTFAVLETLSHQYNILSPMCAIEGARRVLFGQTAVYYNLGISKIWDAAAMALAIQEAGGFVSAPDGEPLRWHTINCDWVVAINADLANIVLRHTKEWCGRKQKG